MGIRHQSSSCHRTMKAFWGLLFMCVLAQGLRDGDVCIHGWKLNPSNCRCYKFQSQAATWTEANRVCQSIAPTNQPPAPPVTARHLASITNQQEQDFIVNLTGGRSAFVGGVKLPDATWAWTDGRKWGSYTNWASFPSHKGTYQPDNYMGRENVLQVNWVRRGAWNDKPFSGRNAYVCQYL